MRTDPKTIFQRLLPRGKRWPVAAALLLGAAPAGAADFTWSASGNTTWSTTADWFLPDGTPASSIPGASDNIVASSGAGNLKLGTTQSIENITLNQANSLNIVSGGTSGTFNVLGSVTNSGAGTLTFGTASSSILTALNISGGLTANAGSILLGGGTSGSTTAVTVGGLTTVANGALVTVVLAGTTASFQGASIDGVWKVNPLTSAAYLTSTGSLGVVTASVASSLLTLNGADTSTTYTYAGSIQDGGANTLGIAKTGAGIQTLSGYNSYSGGTTIGGGTLVVSGGSAVSSTQANVRPINGNKVVTLASTAGLAVGQTVSGAGIQAGSYITAISGNTITLSQTPTSNNPTTLTFGAASGLGTGAVTVNGGGTLLVSGAAALQNGVGAVTVAGGTLASTVSATIGNAVTMTSGTIDSGTGGTVAALTLSGAFTMSGGGLIFDLASASSYDQLLAASIGITGGMLTLDIAAGAFAAGNTYTLDLLGGGSTSISGLSLSYDTSSYSASLNGSTGVLTLNALAVPEQAPLLFGAFGIGVALLLSRRFPARTA